MHIEVDIGPYEILREMTDSDIMDEAERRDLATHVLDTDDVEAIYREVCFGDKAGLARVIRGIVERENRECYNMHRFSMTQLNQGLRLIFGNTE